MRRRSRRVALVALAVVAVVGIPLAAGGDPAGTTSRASAAGPLTTDLLTTTELLTTTDGTPTLTETSTESTATETATTETSTTATTATTTTEATTTALLTTVDPTTNETDDVTNGTDDLTNGTSDLTNSTGDLTNATGNLTNSTDDLTNSTDQLANSTDELANATNATGELANLTDATDSLEDVSAVDAQGRFVITSSSLTGTVTGTVEGDLAVASDPLDGSGSTDGPDSADSPDSADGSPTSDDGTETSTASDGTTAAAGDSSGADAGASGASDRTPTRGERGDSDGGAELVVGFGALTAAALVPQLADALAIFLNAGGMPVSSAAAGSTAAGSTAGVRRALRSRFDRFWRFVAPFRYSRWDDSDPLDHEDRDALYEAIERSPGEYLSAVADRADVALSTARHHLDVLEDEGLVTAVKVRGKRRYYPAHASDVELTAALADEGTAEVLHALARLGASHGGRLADELDRDASTVSHHLSRLEDAGLVEREREGRAVVNRLAPEVRAVLRGDGAEGDGETPAVAD